MLRPRLRPTLSRKVKYWDIAPKAQKKLGREARRGSHDLRKLVGHANFLDVLVSELDISSDDDDDVDAAVQAQSSPVPDESKGEDVAVESDDGDSESDDGWQEYDDSSDDEYHTLVRTISRRTLTASTGLIAERQGNAETTQAIREGYFNIDTPGSTGIANGDAALEPGKTILVDEEYKKDAVVSVAIVSPTMTPLPSPTNDIGTVR
ncbi:hypothetical protein E2P81_ATG11629 [Venturia nashicola]|nr:hypothetical protein E2P81_ATG11629 [Venturia nashicola]